MEIKVKRLHRDAILPYYDHRGDAGLAMHALSGKVLAPGERYRFDMGWALEFDESYVALVLDRGSLGVIRGLKTLGGVFDSNYRGEYNVCLVNLSDQPYEVKKGDKVGQLVLLSVETAKILEVNELSNTNRGGNRFGSTGR